MNWKQILSGVLAAGMLLTGPVQLLASAESVDDTNSVYSAGSYSFEKLSHPDKDVKTADGIVDYLGQGAVDVVTDPEDEDYNAGDRGQNYAWAAVGYGDWLYVGTCYAAIGQTLSLMKSSLGDKYDEKVLHATFDAMFNGDFFNAQKDGAESKGVLVKINTKTGETKVLMAASVNGYSVLFRNATEYNGRL